MFEHKQTVVRSHLFYFCLQCGRDVARGLIGDDGDALVRLQTQTNADGVARARNQFESDGMRI